MEESNIIAHLEIFVSENLIVHCDITPNTEISIGRGQEADIVLPVQSLSKKHCIFRSFDNSVELQDLGSRNGTSVNSLRIYDNVCLHNSDVVRIGHVIINVIIYSQENIVLKNDSEIKNDSDIYIDSTDILRPLSVKESCQLYCAEQENNKIPDSIQKKDSYQEDVINLHSEDIIHTNSDFDTNFSKIEYNLAQFEEDLNASALYSISSDHFSLQHSIYSYLLNNLKVSEGVCDVCGRNLTTEELFYHLGFIKSGVIYCLECICKRDIKDISSLASYKIVKKLGEGGMGAVFEAVQVSMERPVALKIMRRTTELPRSSIQRFFREARIGGKMHHTNIVQFLDCGQVDDIYFLVMEYVLGVNIHQLMQEIGVFHYSMALPIIEQVLQALHYAHKNFQIIHRDIKPDNILINQNGIVKITDFGLAKDYTEAGFSGITKSQTGIGTLFYMAPEQIFNAKFSDQRVDIYSLGATLYEMLTGILPFSGNQIIEVIQNIQTKDLTPIHILDPYIPEDISNIIVKAMQKDPSQRFQSFYEMLRDIQSCCQKYNV
jgi:pSer/pThr/pTyr-binding forkhead associated (FHA) protein